MDLESRYLELPINFERLCSGNRLDELSYDYSIAQNIYTILITESGELTFDPDYGTKIWEYDFTISSFTSEWKDQVTKTIEESVERYVSQMENIRVDVVVLDEQFSDSIKKSQRVKKKLVVTVKGELCTTKQERIFTQSLYLSPITVE